MALPRPVRYGLVGAWLLAAWVVLLGLGDAHAFRDVLEDFVRAMGRVLGPAGKTGSIIAIVRSLEMLVMALAGATLAAPLGLVARASARRHMRATGRDALAPLRRRLAGRPWWAPARLWAPAALAVAITTLDPVGRHFGGGWGAFGAIAALPWAVALTALVRRYLVLLAAPPALPEELVASAPVVTRDDQIFFTAVAVTPEARALVAGFGVATLGVLAAILVTPMQKLVAGGATWVLAWAAVAIAAATAYRRATKIAVGLDGVLVQGTSRRRFFAYRDLEAAEVNASGEIAARAAGRDRLKLQVAGSDADRIDAILARIRDGIARAHAQAGDGAQRFAEAATRDALARAAHGGADYRRRAVSRGDLLALVESPATASETRAAAASALGRAADAEEGERLRIAAERCAEPVTRAVLLRIAAEEEAEAEQETGEKQVRAVR